MSFESSTVLARPFDVEFFAQLPDEGMHEYAEGADSADVAWSQTAVSLLGEVGCGYHRQREVDLGATLCV